jgi:hypothetical protein
LTTLVLAVTVATTATTIFAQRPASAKARDDAYNFYTGQTWGNGAYEHARILNQYSSTGTPVPKQVIQEHATAIRQGVEGARRAYSGLSDKTKKDPTVAKKLAEIEACHTKVLATCDMLDKECAKAEGDATTVMSCCTDITKELETANAAHQALTKQLNMEPYLPPKK